MSFTRAVSTGNYGPARYIVAGAAANGTHQTIQSAINAASSGETIAIRPATFTENLTLKAGVNLVAYTADGFGNVTINGTCTFTGTGTVSMSGIRLQTNGAALLAVTGTLASIVNLKDCTLNCTNATAITFSSSSSSAKINIYECSGNIGTTGISLFAHSSAGEMNIHNTRITNTGSTTTVSTVSAGIFNATDGDFIFPITTSGTASLGMAKTIVSNAGTNATSLTIGGSGIQYITYSNLQSGTASAVSISSTAIMNDCIVDSSNASAVAGAGTLTFSNMIFPNTSSTISTTTQTPVYTNLGKYKATGQPAFSAYIASNDNNVTGDGTQYTVGTSTAFTEVFDIGSNFNTNGTFTAPVTGTYFFTAHLRMSGITAAMTLSSLSLVTTAKSFFSSEANCGAARSISTVADLYGVSITAIANMTAGDTATLNITLFGGTKVADIAGDANMTSYFQGYQIA